MSKDSWRLYVTSQEKKVFDPQGTLSVYQLVKTTPVSDQKRESESQKHKMTQTIAFVLFVFFVFDFPPKPMFACVV